MFSRRMKLATNASLSVVRLANIITMLNTIRFRRRCQYVNKVGLPYPANKYIDCI